MENYTIPEVEVSEEKIQETEEILNYVKEEQSKSEKVRELFFQKPILEKQKKIAFNKSIYKFAYILQWISLVFIAAVSILNEVLPLLLPIYFLFFFLTEVVILEQSRRFIENIRYRKSLSFSLLDLSAVGFYFYFSFLSIWQFIGDVHINLSLIAFWAIYTLIRKIYIYKNLTYEK